jgi:exodeoxyribonuclease V
MEFSPDQHAALEQVEEWFYNGEEPRLTLGGYAGTGKTTLIKELVKRVGAGSARVCAFTGKAAFVLRSKGVNATTMHRLIYTPQLLCSMCHRKPAVALVVDGNVLDETPSTEPRCVCPGAPRVKTEFVRVPLLSCKLVIVDEASMINSKLQRDLEEFEIPVLYVGDHGQLEPIGDNPGLMKDPDIRLEHIHRQAEGSPIIRFAHHVRLGGSPRALGDDRLGDNVRVMADGKHPPNLHEYDMVLCATNRTRIEVNHRIRRLLGFSGQLPAVGERVICLRNNTDHGVFNGMLGTVTEVRPEEAELSIVDDFGNPYDRMPFFPGQFGADELQKDVPRERTLWDFGYCLTVHKSQGSEFSRVVVLERIPPKWSATRWRYTAVTRASDELVYCVPR